MKFLPLAPVNRPASALPAIPISLARLRANALIVLLFAIALLGTVGCASQKVAGTFSRPFALGQDSFSFSNQLFWVYRIDPATGKTTHERRHPSPDYAQHCFVVARSARQFFQHATFDPKLPATDEPTYRNLVRKIITLDPRHELGPAGKIVIPGFANLHEFSAAYEDLLKKECGSMWQSYFQRGHWRMICGFSSNQQRKMAAQLADSIHRNRPPVVHLSHFPRLNINHALLLYSVTEVPSGWEFLAYDPNSPTTPNRLLFDREKGRFIFPPQNYFAGGTVDVYEVYYRWNY